MGAEVCSCLVNTKATTEPTLEKSDQKKGAALHTGSNPMDDTLLSTNTSMREQSSSEMRSSKSNSPNSASLQIFTSAQGRRSYSNPLMGAGIQITGTT